MSKPSLGLKGFLRDPDNDSNKQKILNELIPIDYIIEWFKNRMSEVGIQNRVLILKSSTGSGKSTMFPAETYLKYVYQNTEKRGMISTQPRIMTAKNNVLDIANIYPQIKLGVNIGYSTGSNKLMVSKSELLSVTLQTLTTYLTIMTDDEIMSNYKFIIVDEVHERTLALDKTLFLLKKFMKRCAGNIKCPFLILSSATLDPKRYLEYFECDNTSLIVVEGSAFKREEVWDFKGSSDYMRSACDTVERILTEGSTDKENMGDILIFMAGGSEIERTAGHISNMNFRRYKDGKSVVSIIQLDGNAVKRETYPYRMVSMPLQALKVKIENAEVIPERRVIICTNVAETGVTINTLKYVIDAGFNRETEFNPILNVDILLTKPAPQSRIQQRKGRCGRKFAGVFYPLYSKETFDKLQAQQYPDILSQDLSQDFLKLVHEQLEDKKRNKQEVVFSVDDMDLLTPPAPDMLQACIQRSNALGFFDINKKQLTPMGLIAQKIQLEMESLRMILAGFNWGCSIIDLISIASYVKDEEKSYKANSGNPIEWADIYKLGFPTYFNNSDSTSNIYRNRLLIADSFIDGIALINAIGMQLKDYSSTNAITGFKKWCEKVNIGYEAVIDLIEDRDNLIEQFITAEINIYKNEIFSMRNSPKDEIQTTIRKLKHCIYDGFRLNKADYEDEVYKVKGFEIQTPKLFADIKQNKLTEELLNINNSLRPQNILFYKIKSSLNQKTKMYKLKFQHISVMDGYVNIDDDFL